MNDIIKFLDRHYNNALKLVSDFDITKTKEWNPQIYLNELYVQLGHVYNVLFSDDIVNENNRKIDNLGDEISDVLLQLINLAKILNIDLYEVTKYKDFDYDNISGLSILLGQLTEAIMEMNECRFKKNRSGFNNSYEFVKDRLLKLFIISHNIAKKHNLDISREFSDMLDDANGFLDRFKKENNKIKEYIDIYDEKERLLGYCEKETVHKLGYWHKTFGCLIYNNKTKKVFFQLKNPAHNNINKIPLLEITSGGHLVSGEKIEDGVREIKEETGFVTEFKDLSFLLRRECDITKYDNYIIREFQYFYGLDINVDIKDFKNYDKEEVISFVEIDINDTLKLIRGNKDSIRGKDNKGKITEITIDNFDRAFIEDGLFIDLLTRISIKDGKKHMKRKINKLYRTITKEKMRNPNNYYFDNGQVEFIEKCKKDNIEYCVMMVNTNVATTDYITYILAIYEGNKPIPQLLKKQFNNENKARKYLDELTNIIKNNTNQDIINMCFKEKIESGEIRLNFIEKHLI